MSDERPIPMVLREPARGTYMPTDWIEHSGIDRARMAVERKDLPPIFHLSGLRFTDAGLGMMTVAMPASPWWQTSTGTFAAGVLAFVADAALGGAVLSSAPPRAIISTAALSLDFLRPASTRSQMIIARGRLVHATRTLGLSEVFLEDGRGRVLAHGTSRCVIVPMDAASLEARRPAIEPPGADFVALWQRPVEGQPRGQEYWNTTSGPDVIADILSERWRAPAGILLGSHIVEWADGVGAIGLPASAWFATGGGTIYGGLIAYLADAAANVAIASTLPAATAFAPLDLKVNYLRPALPGDGEITARATRVHAGRKIAVFNVDITGPDGKKIATANESVVILPGRSWDRPVSPAEEATLEA